jgi:hypothetical protein
MNQEVPCPYSSFILPPSSFRREIHHEKVLTQDWRLLPEAKALWFPGSDSMVCGMARSTVCAPVRQALTLGCQGVEKGTQFVSRRQA